MVGAHSAALQDETILYQQGEMQVLILQLACRTGGVRNALGIMFFLQVQEILKIRQRPFRFLPSQCELYLQWILKSNTLQYCVSL